MTRAAGPGPTVGISISDSPVDELVELGLSSLHLSHAFIEIVRHILAAGWSIAYGGDRRRPGFTEAMFDLVRTYEQRAVPGPERVTNYLAWPIWVGRRPEDDAQFANVATLIKSAAPPGSPDALPPASERTESERLLCSQALTAMREQMTAAIDARLVLGGRVAGQMGLVPGVVEEAVLAIDAGVPLYVAGGFGGAGRVIAAALDGQSPPELETDFQLDHTDGYRGLLDAALLESVEPDLEGIASRLASIGLAGLRNGLSQEDNRRLARTDDAEEVVTFVLRGLNRLHGSSPR
ncbi:MAG TPA: hypothetical protein VK611_07735 [Acidimicrobiales bacterium]|nr:hypothetical protein [Acidimicrobiales bacterium]